MMSAYAENSTPPAGDNTTNLSPEGTRCRYVKAIHLAMLLKMQMTNSDVFHFRAGWATPPPSASIQRHHFQARGMCVTLTANKHPSTPS